MKLKLKYWENKGKLDYVYKPLNNYVVDKSLESFSVKSKDLNINVEDPIEMTIEESYDGSANIILNDRKSRVKLINSRFYLTGDNNYKVADREGSLDSNIYYKDKLQPQTSFIKTYQNITEVYLDKIENNGILPIGNYTFYFKTSDDDGNETDFFAESGKVVLFVGDVDNIKSIRGGQVNENSRKSIVLKFKNLDISNPFLKVYYSRTTNIGSNEITTYHKINHKYRIDSIDYKVIITGYETTTEITVHDINTNKFNFNSAKSITNCQNLSFAGNLANEYEVFKKLKNLSKFIYPTVDKSKSIGFVDHKYNDYSYDGKEYYNPKNIYNYVGYWPRETYRFGIVYILNDYTLSPVFDIRGYEDLGEFQEKFLLEINSTTDYNKVREMLEIEGDEFGIINIKNKKRSNIKGIFKIQSPSSDTSVINKSSVTPLGVEFNIPEKIQKGWKDGSGFKIIEGLEDLTKGYFIVRQKRIPHTIAQAYGIATSKNGNIPLVYTNDETLKHTEILQYKDSDKNPKNNKFYAETFLSLKKVNDRDIWWSKDNLKILNLTDYVPILKSNYTGVPEELVNKNALICPDATLNPSFYYNYFNGSSFLLSEFLRPLNSNVNFKNSQSYIPFYINGSTSKNAVSKLVLVESGVESISIENHRFSSKAGDSSFPHLVQDVLLGDFADPENSWSADNHTLSSSKVRGVYNTYLGSTSEIDPGVIYNISLDNSHLSEENSKYKELIRIRTLDSQPYFAVSQRYSWDRDLKKIDNNYKTPVVYGGDCYTVTYTHRLNWNFIDSDLPTNTKILDPYTWALNYKIKEAAKIIHKDIEKGTAELKYNKLLEAFTIADESIESSDLYPADDDFEFQGDLSKILEPGDKNFKKYSDSFGIFGVSNISRPDINAIPLGTWITFKLLSNNNLGLRDHDSSYPEEEAVHGLKRSFHPFQVMDKNIKLPESKTINKGLSASGSSKYHFNIGEAPYIKDTFPTRIAYSLPLQKYSYQNNQRIFKAGNYKDYSTEFGSITKLVEWYGNLVAVMETGILLLPINEKALLENAQGKGIYVGAHNVLPENPTVLSNLYGSIWPDSVVKTNKFIYGLDTKGKKIWRTNGKNFEIISDLKIQSFLNDNINLSYTDKKRNVYSHTIKTHYNAFKHDIMFTFKYGEDQWNLVWNEALNKWTTRYTWFPEFSENINNIFYTFANKSIHEDAGTNLYKHGFAGNLEEQGDPKPTYWYDEQHKFEFEFVVADQPAYHKIFNNIKILSNNVKPEGIFYGFIGDALEWSSNKSNINDILNEEGSIIFDRYKFNLRSKLEPENLFNNKENYRLHVSSLKIPYIKFNKNLFNIKVLKGSELSIVKDRKKSDFFIQLYQKAKSLRKFGRIKGNIEYIEDMWNLQIQPLTFNYVYLTMDNKVKISDIKQSKIRDKFIKIRMRYDGEDYVMINLIKTFYTISYA